MSDQKPQRSEQQILIEEELPKPIQQIQTSQKQNEQYQKKMLPYLNYQQQHLTTNILKDQLINQNVFYDESLQFVDTFTLILRHSSINKEVVVLNCRWGKFSINCFILNIQDNNIKHGVSTDGGNHGNIYKGSFDGNKVAIKCIPILNMQDRHKAIKQWFLLKVASALEIGPKIQSCLGFDILMYNECIQFCMEICENYMSHKFNIQNLYWSLSVMHKFHLVHLDIKPENVMLSPTYRKAVFIDFGLSKIIKEQIGFKTYTSFIGTVNFCSDEMMQCRIKKSQNFVDLYYNDLSGLKMTVIEIVDSINQPINSYSEDFIQIFPPIVNDFSYLSIILIKYYLFRNDINPCINYLIRNEKYQTKYGSQILEFLLELVPTQQLKMFFQDFNNELQQQSLYFSKLKIVYDTNKQKLWSLDFFHNQDKIKIFQQYFSSFFVSQKKDSTKQHHDIPNQKQFLMNPKLISKCPFKEYVDKYLKFISFVNNCQNRNRQDRSKAAQVFYKTFIKKQIPQNMEFMQILEATIKFLIQWCLKSIQMKQNYHCFALFYFRIFDILAITDIGTVQQTFQWINNFMEIQLPLYYKYFFVIKVSQIQYLNNFRKTKKKGFPRISYINVLGQWAEQYYRQVRQFPLFRSDPTSQKSNQFKEIIGMIPSEFMNEIGDQIVYYFMIQHSQASRYTENLVQLSNKIGITKGKCFQYWLLELFHIFYYKQLNHNKCQKIYKVISNNINDSNILSQFIFDIYLNYFQFLFTYSTWSKIQNLEQYFKKLDQEFSSVEDEQLLLFKRFIVVYSYKLYQKSFVQKKQQFLYSDVFINKNSSVNRLVNIYIGSLEQTLLKENSRCRPTILSELKNNKTIEGHRNVQALQFFQFLRLNELTQSHRKQLQELLENPQKIKQIKCNQCKYIFELNIIVIKLQRYIANLNSLQRTNTPQQELKEVHRQVSIKAQQLRNYYSDSVSGIFLDYIEIVNYALRMAAYTSYLNPKREKEYNRIINHYKFVMNFNRIDLYFSFVVESHFLIKTALQILYEQNYNQYISFIFKITSYVQTSHSLENLKMVNFYMIDMLEQLDQEQIQQLFLSLREAQPRMGIEGKSIIHLYTLLMNSQAIKKYQGKLAKIIYKNIRFIDQSAQRHIGLSILFQAHHKVKAEKINCRRDRLRAVYINNKLLKLLTINGDVQSQEVKPKCNKGKIKCLKQKISNFGRFESYPIQFLTNLKSRKSRKSRKIDHFS